MVDVSPKPRPTLALLFVGAAAQLLTDASSAQPFRATAKVKVAQSTRIDWLYPLSGTSPADVPEGVLKGYASSRQRYALYAPDPRAVRGRAMPLVLFISYRSTPIGWSVFGPTCARRQVMFAEPHNAGNATPMAERIRIVLDVLDDIRRRYTIDPDRTYLAGYSGGGTTASKIVLALPEYFGGLIASNTFVPLPRDPSTLERLRSRLSVVMFAGERESLSLNVGKLDGPIFAEFGVHSRYRVFAGLGHAMPAAAAFDDAFQWLEQGLPQRRALAVTRPATRVAGSPSREEQAKLFFEDAHVLLEDEGRVHIGLALLDVISKRWPDLPHGVQAREVMEEYKYRDERPWKETARKERLAQTLFLAELYDREAGGTGLSKVERSVLAQGAIDNWRILINDSDDEALVARARSRIAPLQKLVANAKAKTRLRRALLDDKSPE